MDLRHLAYLVALVREQHFGRAARACDVTQPTLSSGIRRLESDVGFPIVRRAQRYEGLTPEGERVLEWARRILADVDGLEAEMEAMHGGLSGELRIGAIPTSLPCVSLLTTPLVATHPGITISVYSLNSRQIERGLDAFELELGITYLDSEPLGGVRTLPLYREQYVLLTHADGAARRTERRHVGGGGRAAALPAHAGHAEPSHPRRHLPVEAGAEPRPTVETNSIETLIAHVRDGPWSSVMAGAWLHGAELPPGMKAIPLVKPAAIRTVGLVWLDREPEPILARALLEIARRLDVERALRR